MDLYSGSALATCALDELTQQQQQLGRMAAEDNSILLHMPDRGTPAASQEAMQE
jgi:hypothetical protein